MRKFGIRILEGYGATETSPVISINTPMYIREGSVGRLFPKMTARLEEVPGIKEGKKLLVSGDNVMQGYMFADNPGVLVPPKDGWHDTGDIVTIDKDGFVFIQGRGENVLQNRRRNDFSDGRRTGIVEIISRRGAGNCCGSRSEERRKGWF